MSDAIWPALRDVVDTVDGRGAGLDRDKAGKADVSREALHWMTRWKVALCKQAEYEEI